MADHPERVVALHQRRDDPPATRFGTTSETPTVTGPLVMRGGALQDPDQVLPAGKDLVGVFEDGQAQLGRHDPPALLFEQAAVQLRFQQLDLAADGLRRDVQRSRQPARRRPRGRSSRSTAGGCSSGAACGLYTSVIPEV